MKDTLVSFIVAKLAKEKGFNGDCYNIYLQKESNEPYVEDSHFYYWQTTTSNLYIEDIIETRKKLQIKYPNENYYTDEVCTAPTQSLLSKWLREVHNIHVNVEYWNAVDYNFKYKICYIDNKKFNQTVFSDYFSTYEQALEKGLFESLKLIKNE